MPYQNISAVLTQADVDAIKAAIATITSKIPFAVSLEPDEVQGLVKVGDKSVDFVQDALLAATNFPTILPASFNMTEYSKDAALFKAMTEIKFVVDSLQEKIHDTTIAVGSESMIASLEVYNYVQSAAARTPGLQSVADKLKTRFRKSKKKVGDATPQ